MRVVKDLEHEILVVDDSCSSRNYLSSAEQEHLSHLRFLESLEQADRAIRRAESLDAMMTGVLDTALSIFESDRAWLLYPCDLDAQSWRVPMERTRSGYPGALVMGIDFPASSEIREAFRASLHSSEPVVYDSRSGCSLPPEVSRQFLVQSQIMVAVYPKRGKPWLFGMHQCSHARNWEEQDVRLFKEISRRIADGLSSMLFLREMQESKEKLSSTLASMDDLVFVLDKDGRFLDYFQPTDKPGPHGPPEGLLGKTFREALPPHIAEPLEKGIRAVLSSGAVQQVEYRVAAEGEWRWYCAKASARKDAAGAFAGVTIVARDVTEAKRTEEDLRKLGEDLEQRVIDRTSQLEAANAELTQLALRLESAYEDLKSAHLQVLQQEKMASIGQLAAGVAHEINNPMGFIISNLNTLKKYADRISGFVRLQSELLNDLADLDDTCYQRAVEGMQEHKKAMKLDYVMDDLPLLLLESLDGAERVKAIVQNLKSFSRVDASERRTVADINGGLESTINLIWNELKYKAVVRKEYGSIPATECNLGQMNQVFLNILMNAAQAIETQGTITVKSWSERETIYVAISDSGPGIPAETLQRVFEPFFTTKEVGEGTGLGLSIAYDIVKKHQGRITVESDLGKGTTFTIAVPVIG